LKFALKTSQELEEIFATNPLLSNEAKEILKKVRESQEKLDSFEQFYQVTKTKIEQKENELEGEKNSFQEKVGNYNKQKLQEKLTKLLNFQKDITDRNAPSAVDEKEEIIKKLVDKTSITENELINLCQLQKEITELEIQLQITNRHKSKQITQIINNITNNQGLIFNDCHSVDLTNVAVQGNTMINQTTPQKKDISDEEELISRTKRQLSIDSQIKTNQGETKQTKLEQNQLELMELDQFQTQTTTSPNFPKN
jgi:hypothetical protein